MQLFINNFDWFFLVYGMVLFSCYFLFIVLAVRAIRKNKKSASFLTSNQVTRAAQLPSVSLIAPAYNEGKTIAINVQSLLSLQYPDYELIIVNDGSTDDSLEQLIRIFDLVLRTRAISDQVIKSAAIKSVYTSTNPLYKKLTVINKENGGRADALNCGIANATTDLVLCTDADCIIEQNALIKMVRPYLEATDKEIIASGAGIGIANDSVINNGTLQTLKLPKSIIAKVQVVEYMRAFLLARMAWSSINGVFLVSGAFGLYPKKRVVEVGGFDKDTVGEDLELCIRLRVYMERLKLPYDVVYLPETLCWTEAPETPKVYISQRDRWARGLFETIKKHRYLFYNPKYKSMGSLFFPYWVYFELFAPIVELVGLILLVVFMVLGKINYPIAMLLFTLVYLIGVIYSTIAVLIFTYNFNKYATFKKVFQLILVAFTEPFTTHPILLYAEIKGYFKKVFKIKSTWGVMSRKGFITTKD